MAERTLTAEQERVLLWKHTSGAFPGQKWATIQALLHAGMLATVERGKITDVVVTAKGKAYCDANHARMAF